MGSRRRATAARACPGEKTAVAVGQVAVSAHRRVRYDRRSRLCRPAVCGYSEASRARRVLWMVSLLKGYADDSGNDGKSPVFVLGAFVGTVENWKRFSGEWDDALHNNGYKNLDYFKMKEAAAREVQFAGWERDKRDAFLLRLISIIERYAVKGVATTIPGADYREVFKGKIAKGMDTPYFLSFYALMAEAHRFQLKTNEQNRIDFVFDEQGRQIGSALRAWRYWIGQAQAGQEFTLFLGERPQSGDDKIILPLQAADLLAWRTRRLAEDAYSNQSIANKILPFSMDIEVDIWDRPRLENVFTRIRQMSYSMGRLLPYELPRKARRAVEKRFAVESQRE